MANLSMLLLKQAMRKRIAAVLVGPPGTGKTTTIKALAQEMGYDLIILIGSRLDPQDVSGFPTRGVYVDREGVERPVTEYAPQFWQREVVERKKVIIFLDEASNTPPATRASMLSLIQDRQFPNGELFPDETIIVAAMNPTDSAADGFELDAATCNRLCHIAWTLDHEEWFKGMLNAWGQETDKEEAYWRRLIVGFLKDNPGAILRHGKNDLGNGETYGIKGHDSSSMTVAANAYPSPRSWENTAVMLAGVDRSDKWMQDAVVSSLVGNEMSVKLREWLDNHELNVADVVRDPESYGEWGSLEIGDAQRVAEYVNNMDGFENGIDNGITVYRKLGEHAPGFVASHFQTFMKRVNEVVPTTHPQREVVKKKLLPVARLYSGATRRSTSMSAASTARL